MALGGMQLVILAGLWLGAPGLQLGREEEEEVRDATALVQMGQVQVHEHDDRQRTKECVQVFNGDFESGTLGEIPDGWKSYYSGTTGKLVDDEAYSGSRSVYFEGAGWQLIENGPDEQYAWSLQSGVTYTVTFWAKTANGNSGYRLRIEFLIYPDFTAASSFDTQLGGVEDQYFDVTGSWTQYSYTFTPTQTSSNLRMNIGLAATSPDTGRVYVDDVSFAGCTEAPTMSPTAMVLWGDMGWDNTICKETRFDVADQYECQAAAVAAGHSYYQYTPTFNTGIPQCETSATCDNPLSGRTWPYRVYYELATASPTASPTAAPTPASEAPNFEYLGTDVPIAAYTQSGNVAYVIDTETLTIGGTNYPKNIFAHADATLKFALDGKYSTFSTCFGLRQGDPDVTQCGHTSGTVTFTVNADGEQLYQEVDKESGAATCIVVNVSMKMELELLTDKGTAGLGTCDWSTWADAKLVAVPTPEATVSANLVGDPHITSVHGDRFDVHLVGNVTLLQIPKTTEAEPLLKLTGLLHKTDASCREGTYLTALHVDGAWVPQKREFYPAPRRSAGRKKQRVSVGPYGISIVVVHGKTDTGVPYLNLRVNNLGRLQLPIGGLLGGGASEALALGQAVDCA